MNVLNKIKQLTDKKHGPGLSMTVIGRYIGCNPNSITYYMNGITPRQEIIEQYEQGLKNLFEDIKKIVEE